MADPVSVDSAEVKKIAPLNPVRPLIGAVIAGGLSFLIYRLTTSIALSFATHPIHTSSQITFNISSAIRTLVVGLSVMATGISAIAALGLLALTVQMSFQHLQQPKES